MSSYLFRLSTGLVRAIQAAPLVPHAAATVAVARLYSTGPSQKAEPAPAASAAASAPPSDSPAAATAEQCPQSLSQEGAARSGALAQTTAAGSAEALQATGLPRKTNYENLPIGMRRPINGPEDLPKAPFQPGRKEVFLPWYVVTLMKSPTLPATWAKFQVPMRFGKLDLRDYLWHMYGVHAVRIRSFIKQESPKLEGGKRWFRPQSKKYMVIQMDEPFYWPEDPKDLSPWRPDLHKVITDRDPQYYEITPHARLSRANRDLTRFHASKLRQGTAKWSPQPASFANPVFSRPGATPKEE